MREGYKVETVHVTSLAARQVDTKICRNCIQLSELESSFQRSSLVYVMFNHCCTCKFMFNDSPETRSHDFQFRHIGTCSAFCSSSSSSSQKPPPKVEGIGSDLGKKTQIVVALKDKNEHDSICRAVSFGLRNGGLRAELCTVNKVSTRGGGGNAKLTEKR